MTALRPIGGTRPGNVGSLWAMVKQPFRRSTENLSNEDHMRIISIIFKLESSENGTAWKRECRLITEHALFDECLKKGDESTHAYNLISLRILKQSSVPKESVEWFEDPENSPYDIRALDGHKFKIYGRCYVKWLGEDKKCAEKEIFLKGRSMYSWFLVISEEANPGIIISWDTMKAEELRKRTSIFAGGQGGFRAKQPSISDDKQKEAELQAIRDAERAAEDQKDREKSA